LCWKFNEIEDSKHNFCETAGNPAEIFQRTGMKNFNEKNFFSADKKSKSNGELMIKWLKSDEKMKKI
jgi:hypothetical protein